jgi:hypothetical protein
MILWGWMRRPTVLGVKLDQCDRCGSLTHHALVRSSYWFHLFWIPVVLFRLRHDLMCTKCGERTGLAFSQAHRAFKDESLPLPARQRSAWPYIQEELWQQTGKRPNQAEFFDPVIRNPKRGFSTYT